MKSKAFLYLVVLALIVSLIAPASPVLAFPNAQTTPPPGHSLFLPSIWGVGSGPQPTATATTQPTAVTPGPSPTATATLRPGETAEPTPTSTPTLIPTDIPLPTDAEVALTAVGPESAVAPNAQFDVTVSLRNNGAAEATGLVVSVTLDLNRVTFVSANPSSGTYNSSTNQWSVPQLAIDATTSLTLTLRTKATAAGTIPTTAAITAATKNDPDPNNNTATANTTVSLPAGGPIRTVDFNYAGDPYQWTVVDPIGDTNVRVDGTHLNIGIPANVPHRTWRNNTNYSPRVVQSVNNPSSFDIVAKFDSRPSGTYTAHGVLVESNESNFILYELFSYGSTLKIYAATIIANIKTTVIDQTVTNAFPVGQSSNLRVSRSGSSFTLSYSAGEITDATVWTEIPTFQFGNSVRLVGVYAATSTLEATATNSPAYTAKVDFFYNSSDVGVVPEDERDPSFIDSDDFSGSYDEDVWSVYDPVGQKAQRSFSATQMTLYVQTDNGTPEMPGVEHDIWASSVADPTQRVQGYGLIQSANNRDFQIEVKFDSIPQNTYTAEGIVIRDENLVDLVQFYFYSVGTQVRIYASKVEDGTPALVAAANKNVEFATPDGTSLYLRLTRSGYNYTFQYSSDGTTWLSAGSLTTSMSTDQVLLLVGNEDYNSNGVVPGLSAKVDYFQNNNDPIPSHE